MTARAARAFLLRRWPSLSVGAIPGLAIGIATGYYASAPAWEGLAVVLPLGAGAIFFVILCISAFWRPVSAAAALLMLVVSSLIGFSVAPGAPGSAQAAPGTLLVGGLEGPASVWTGDVTCEWKKDRSDKVESIRGFNVTIDDVTYTVLWVSGEITHPIENGYTSEVVALENVSHDGRTGTARFSGGGGVWFRWTCNGGP